MTRLVCLCGALFCLTQRSGAMSTLYTNALNDTAVSLFSDVSITNAATQYENEQVAGISFEYGAGSGELIGTGDFSVYNFGEGTHGGAASLYGLRAVSTVVTSYTGNITVINDRSVFTNTSKSVFCDTRGISGSVVGNLTNRIKVLSCGGVATETGADECVRSLGIGAEYVEVALAGDLTGRIDVRSISGSSSVTNRKLETITASCGVLGVINGDVKGSVSAISEGASLANSERVAAVGIDGDVNGDISGHVGAMGIGGTSVQNESVSVTAIRGDVNGNISGQIIAFANDGQAENCSTTVYGLEGDLCGDFSGQMLVAALAGNAGGSSNVAAVVEAGGIYGKTVRINNYSGRISVLASA